MLTAPITSLLPRSTHGYVDRVPLAGPAHVEWPGNDACGLDASGDPTSRVVATGRGARAVAVRRADGSWWLRTGYGKLFGRAVPQADGTWRLVDDRGLTVARAGGPDGEVIALFVLRKGWGASCLPGELP